MKLDETSKLTEFKQELFGTKKNIFTFAIASPENPMGPQATLEENENYCRRLEFYLRKNKLKYFKVEGSYGQIEHSYLIGNINLDLCKVLFGKNLFNQESFIFGRTNVGNYGYPVFSCYERTEDSDYEEDSTEIHNMAEAEDYFTRYIGYKFTITFKMFSDDMQKLSDRLDEYYIDSNYRDILQELSLCQNRTMKYLYEGYNVDLRTKRNL